MTGIGCSALPPSTWQFRAFEPTNETLVCTPQPCTYQRVLGNITTETTCETSYSPPTGTPYVIAGTNWTDLSTCTGVPARARGFAEGKCVVPTRGSGSVRYTCTAETIIVETCTDTVCGSCSYASQSTVCAQSSGVSYYCVGDTFQPEPEPERGPFTTEGIVVLSAVGVGVLLVGVGIGALIMRCKYNKAAKASNGYHAINENY